LSVIKDVIVRHNTRTDFSSTTTGFSHGGDNLKVLNNIRLEFLSVVPEAGIHNLTDKLNRRLSAEDFLARHVEIINESDSLLLSLLGLVFVLSFLLVVRFNDVLDSRGLSSSGEVDSESLNRLVLDIEERLNSLSLTDTRNTDEHDVLINAE